MRKGLVVSVEKNTGEIRVELDLMSKECERDGCSGRATGTVKVGRFQPFLCQDDLTILKGPKSYWQIKMRRELNEQLENSFMRSQVPVWIPKSERLTDDG
jgi:hypothetical protein